MRNSCNFLLLPVVWTKLLESSIFQFCTILALTPIRKFGYISFWLCLIVWAYHFRSQNGKTVVVLPPLAPQYVLGGNSLQSLTVLSLLRQFHTTYSLTIHRELYFKTKFPLMLYPKYLKVDLLFFDFEFYR